MNSQKGQSLIEAMVALGAAVAVIAAIAITVVSSVNNSTFTKNQNLANQYAKQGIEIVRQLSRSNWTTLQSYNAIYYCLPQGGQVLDQATAGVCPQNIGIFVRQVNIEQNSISCSGAIRATVIVSWADGACTNSNNPYCHKSTLDSCFTNLNRVPSP